MLESCDSQKYYRKLVNAFARNMGVWRAIQSPSPANFFENLLPQAADGDPRQALVLCWMMLPRGKRSVKAVCDVVTSIFQRTLESWEIDNEVFTKGPSARKKAAKKERDAVEVADHLTGHSPSVPDPAGTACT